MTERTVPSMLRRLVIERARNRCEYCLLPALVTFFPHEIDHVVARKHGGATEEANLAYTCWRCNRYKGTDLGSFDPLTAAFCLLYNPRTHIWAEHFSLDGAQISGQTSTGRTTVRLLQINTAERVDERQRLIAIEAYP